MTERETRRSVRLGPLAGPLGRRLLLGFLLLSLMPLLVSNGLGYMRSEVIIEGLVERYLNGIADLQARHVSSRLDGLAVALEELSEHAAVTERARTDAAWDEVPLESILEDYPDFDAVYVFDERGELLASAPLSPADLGLWIGPTLSSPVQTFEVRREARAPSYPFVRLAVAIPTDGGDRGPLYVGATVSVGTSLLEIPEHTAGSVETIVVDDSGRPVFVSHPHEALDYGARLDVPLLAPGSPTSAVYLDRLGTPVLGTVIDVPSYPWRLINEVPVADALQELRGLREISLWLGTILAVFVLAASWLIAGRVVAPVRRLVAATRQLGRGEMSARVEVVGGDEIGELGSSFNRMATELQRTSERVDELHREEMERAAQLATVGELAAGVAHEIKNPIAGISGGMDLVAKRVPNDPEMKQIIEEIRRQTSRVDVAVRALLSFARPVEPRLAHTDVNLVARRSKTLTAAAAEGSGVVIREELEEGLPPVPADEELLEQCLVNLLINAIQAAGPEGVVVLGTTPVPDGVQVSVTDSGDGIPADRMEDIFRPFFTTKHQGTGLGLSITRDIISRHGGRIAVESEVGEGTTFTVWLPVERSAADEGTE